MILTSPINYKVLYNNSLDYSFAEHYYHYYGYNYYYNYNIQGLLSQGWLTGLSDIDVTATNN